MRRGSNFKRAAFSFPGNAVASRGGINTGVALAGAVGTQEQQEYTVIGNTVNLAVRIDGLNKQFPDNDVLISEWIYEALGVYRGKFDLVFLGSVPICGKNQPSGGLVCQG